METTNEIQIESLINNNRQTEPALCAKLDWLRLRCLLETKACMIKDVATYNNADALMENFITDYLKNVEGIEIEENKNIINILKQKTEELEKEFYDFLSELENNEKDINESWKKNASEFISKLKNYREMGTIDQNIDKQLMDYAKKINNDPLRYIYELIQNADDCEYSGVKNRDNGENLVEVKIEIEDESLTITYPEDGMTYSDIIAITTIGQSNKRKKKKKRIIGEKGRGFKTIFSVCDCAEIHSGPFHFKLSQNSFLPEWIDFNQEEKGTKMILHFKNNFGEVNPNEKGFSAGEDLFEKIKERYGFNENKKENILKNCPIIFTNSIEKLVIKYDTQELCMDVKKDIQSDPETNPANKKKGTLTVSYSNNNTTSSSTPEDLVCYWYEKDVVFTYEEYISHYKEIIKNEEEFKSIAEEVKTYPIVLLAPKGEENINKWKGNMYTYLPTFTNINAPISIHAPLELNEDRSCMWIKGLKGDDHVNEDYEDGYSQKDDCYTTKWNRRLFSELFVDQKDNPSLLKYAYEQLVDELKNNEIYDYIPKYKINDHSFFQSQDQRYAECVRKINKICIKDSQNIIFENFKTLKFLKCLYNDSLFCCNDKPLYFDNAIDLILQSIDNGDDKNCTWVWEFLNDSKNAQNDTQENGEQKNIPIIKSLNGYDNILALGVKKAEVNDKVDFANELLKNAYDMTVKELVKDTCSDYLPQKDGRESLKAIKIDNILMGPKDAELWILMKEMSEENQAEKISNNCLKIIQNSTGVKDDKEKDILYSEIYGEIYGKSFTNKVENKAWNYVWKYIYSKNGDIESINCSFGLYKELMCFYGKTDNWYEYSNKCLNKEDEKGNISKNKECTIPAENLKTIWKLKYQEYRGDNDKKGV